MRSGVVPTVGLALTLLAGCGGASPVSPGESKAAKLVLTDLSVIATRLVDPPVWAYDPRFRIIETSGRSGAVIKKVRVATPVTVAPLDSIALRGPQAEALDVVAPGEGVLVTGADIQAGMPLRAAGDRLRATDQALLSMMDISRVAIREPRIRLVRAPAGNPAIAAGYGWLAATLADAGAAVVADAGDEMATDRLQAAFHHEGSDAILALGGTGEGASDTSVSALAQAGRVAFHGVGLTPGETAAFGIVGARTVLLLPGRFDAALAAWLTLGRHWLKTLSASGEEDRSFMAQLSRKVTSTIGMAEVVPVRCRAGAAEPLANGYLGQAALARADGWILVPPESEGYPVGTPVAGSVLLSGGTDAARAVTATASVSGL